MDWLRRLGVFLLNIVTAIFGTAIVTSPFAFVLRPHTIQAVLLKGYVASAVLAALIGFFIYRRWGSGSAKWVAVVGVCWFAFRLLTLMGGGVSGMWPEMSGMGCVNGVRNLACMNWLVFTLPALRLIFYSLGAWICFWSGSRGDSAFESALVGDLGRGAQNLSGIRHADDSSNGSS
jgi:hypothetical protein